MKQKTKQIFKTGILILGIVTLLWNCQNENIVEDISISQNLLTIPTIENSKANFENTNNGNHIFLEHSTSKSKKSSTSKKSSSNLELNVDWESSTVKSFDENVNILYTPVKTNATNRMKTFLASVNNDGEIETYSLTLFYDEESNQNQFSGIILKFAIEGHLLKAFKYDNGIKIETYIPKENLKAKGLASKPSCQCTLADAIANVMYGFSSDIALDCFCLTSGGGGGGHTPFDISQNNWSNPNNNLTNNSNLNNYYTTGGGSNSGGTNLNNNSSDGNKFENALIDWWAEDDKIFNELTGKDLCVFNELKKLGLFKSTIGKFSKGNYNLTFKYGTTCNNQAGEEACTDPKDLANGNLTIKILGSGTQSLDFAATLLHEGIHAEIYKYVDEHKKGIDPNDRKNLFFYYNLYSAQNNNRRETSLAQHQHMQDVFVTPIARAIRQLDGYKHNIDYYKGFAFAGIIKKYGYDKYWDNGELKTMTPDIYKSYENKMYNVISTTKFKDALKNCN